MLRRLFPISLFLSALLLFSIQPMVAKALLPTYGGTPAVWIVCMLFFQLILLISYAYVWLLSLFKKPITWRLIHVVLIILSITLLPLVFNAHPISLKNHPEWSILYNLISQLGLPLLVIGASAPLLQFAYSQTDNKSAADPYFLYAASNLGSLIALLIYPWVIERFIGLTYQFHLWNIAYIIYIFLLAIVFFAVQYQPLERQYNSNWHNWPWRKIMYWVFLSFVPCSLMLGVTLYITTDVAATPLFWIAPLTLYLLSFIFTFTTKPPIPQSWLNRNGMFFLIFILLGFILGVTRIPIWEFVLVNLLSFFILALLCHGQLFASRPQPQHLPLFYFCLSLGGVLAGIFNGILAPHWFNQVYEYPFALLLVVLIFPHIKTKKGWWVSLLVLFLLVLAYYLPPINWPKGFYTYQIAAIVSLILIIAVQKNSLHIFSSLVILFIFIFSPALQHKQVLFQERNFYGVKQIFAKGTTHILMSQSTVHGLQDMNDKIFSGSNSYYGTVKGVVEALQRQFNQLSVTIIGLGTGTTICQFRTKDTVQVIEIDPQVINIAKDPHLFTYMRDCHPQVQIIKDDGRLAIAKMADHSQDLIILDAFNSDAVPIHLMTREAFSLYDKKITRQGAIAIHLSNRYLDLMPIVNAAARSLDLMVFQAKNNGDPKLGQFYSEWALLTANEQLAFQLMRNPSWHFFTDSKQFLWTDDYSNIIPILRWY